MFADLRGGGGGGLKETKKVWGGGGVSKFFFDRMGGLQIFPLVPLLFLQPTPRDN